MRTNSVLIFHGENIALLFLAAEVSQFDDSLSLLAAFLVVDMAAFVSRQSTSHNAAVNSDYRRA